MKRADLEKRLGKKIAGKMQQEAHPDRYGSASAHVADKREQRDRDKAAGLVPFAVKLPQSLVAQLQSLASERQVSLNDIAAELLAGALVPGESAAAPDAGGTAQTARKPRAAKSAT